MLPNVTLWLNLGLVFCTAVSFKWVCTNDCRHMKHKQLKHKKNIKTINLNKQIFIVVFVNTYKCKNNRGHPVIPPFSYLKLLSGLWLFYAYFCTTELHNVSTFVIYNFYMFRPYMVTIFKGYKFVSCVQPIRLFVTDKWQTVIRDKLLCDAHKEQTCNPWCLPSYMAETCRNYV